MTGRPSPIANVLIADDTVENLRLLATMLGGQGYEVRPVTNGCQALLAAERDPPDLILLDINMPDMNGYEVCARLKKIAQLRDIPVIFLTALSDITDKVKAFEVGGIDYITKPFQLEEVHARVRTHIALRRASLELSRSFEKLQVLEQLRDDLVHMIVHDMRSPLMILIAHISLLQKETEGTLSKDAEEDLEATARAAEVIKRMANDLLDVSRLESGKMPVERREHELTAIVLGVRDALSNLDRRRMIEVESSGSIVVSCDDGLVRRVLENLIGNAIKHTPSNGRISISVSATSAGVRVAVADEGSGVSPEAKQKIFEKFGTVATRKDHSYHSAGLGLAFCKLAVQAHEGNIGVDSREPKGSIFWFELPR